MELINKNQGNLVLYLYQERGYKMAGNIKGITVEIGGNVEPLSNALKDVNKTSRELQSELKQVNNNLKFNPKDTEMLSQKQKLLASSISNTKEKLDTLKSAEKQAQEQFQRGDISEEKYRALQREISKTTNELKGMEKQYKELEKSSSSALTDASDKLNKFGSKCETAGKKMLPVSAGVTAVGVAGVAAFNAVDDGADNAIKKTGATGDAAKELESTYKDVASNIVGDFGDIGNAVGEANTRFGFTGEKLQNCTEEFLKFAEINDTDVVTSIQKVARYMGDASIESDKYGEVLDQLTVAGQASGIAVDTLAEDCTKFGAPMRALGMDTKESIAIFASWEKAGVNTDIAFSGMKKAIGTWGKEGKDARVEFKKTLDEIKNCPDIASATAKSIEVFGQKAGPDLADAIQGGRFEYSQMLDLLESSQGSVENTFDGIKDGGYDAELAAQNAKVALSGIGETILALLAPALQTASRLLKNFSNWFNNLSPGAKKAIVVIGGIIAAIAPVLIIVGKVAKAISSVLTAVNNVRKAISLVHKGFTILKAAMLANPITIVIAVIVALVAAFVLLWNKCEAFRNFWINLGNAIKDIASNSVNAVIGFFTKTIPEGFASAKEAISNKVQSIGDSIKNGFNTAIDFITSLPGKALQWGADFIDGLVNGIVSKAHAITNAVSGVAGKIKNFLHFSVPDEGPLTDYESWMPDFMAGLAEGIQNNKRLVTDAIGGLSSDITLNVDELNKNPISGSNPVSNGSRVKRDIVVPVYLEGKEVARGIAPYQDVFDDYMNGR